MELYERIRARREELGLSQTDLADRMGYTSRSTVCKIEAGQRSLTHEQICKFAEALSVTPGYLMGLSDRPEKEETENLRPTNTLAAHFEGETFSPKELEEIENFVNFVKSRRGHEGGR